VKWLEVLVSADAEAAEVVAETLRPFGHGGVVIEQIGGPIAPEAEADGWEPGTPDGVRYAVRVYLPAPGEPGGERTAAARRRIEEALYHLNRIYPIPAPQFAQISDEDWATAWKKHYAVLRVGRQLVICPAWIEYIPQPGDLVLRLDPGMAFGTGLHPSTQLCLAALEDRLHGGERVLDVGTGSGILAIAAARLGAAHVDALDIDPVAVEAARGNARLNGLEECIALSTGSAGSPAITGSYDVLVVNILARVIVELVAAGLVAPLAPGGTLIAAGIIDHQAEDVVRALDAAGVTISEQRAVKDWVALIGHKR
jgi:ribosomal protein L11 methyltransferase